MPSVFLDDRGVARVSGEDARALLQGLFTCDTDKVAPGHPAFGALLTPQGKIVVDFLVHETGEGFWLDCPLALAVDFVKRLRFYKLRARVEIADLSATHGVAALWGEDGEGEADPRAPGLGRRIIGDRAALASAHGRGAEAAYEALRVSTGVPRGGVDFAYGETFPHEANMDLLHGVDFRKGCYVGQEVVSRVQHRGTARKRIVRVRYAGPPPAPGTPVLAGEIEIGVTGSVAGGEGLAMLRTDRAREALAAGGTLMAGGTRVLCDLAASP